MTPAQYYLANGGNPALISQFLNMLSSMPGDISGDPAKAFAAWKQGASDPARQGLTYNGSQWVNAQGAAYNQETDPAAQAALTSNHAGWNQMFQNSQLYNNGGRLNVTNPDGTVGAANVYGNGAGYMGARTGNYNNNNNNNNQPAQGTTAAPLTTKPLNIGNANPIAPNAPQGSVSAPRLVQPPAPNTGSMATSAAGGGLNPNRPANAGAGIDPVKAPPNGEGTGGLDPNKPPPPVNPPPSGGTASPTTPVSKSTQAYGGAAQYGDTGDVGTMGAGMGMGNPYQPNMMTMNNNNPNSGVNPYQPTKNPYTLNSAKGWNV